MEQNNLEHFILFVIQIVASFSVYALVKNVMKLKSNILLSRICLSIHRIGRFFPEVVTRFIINKLSVTCKHSDIGKLSL